ncbi:MAG TPA: GNAT family N-acetyltransferase [Petrimonas sp.]|jgi:predicted acetyltransferase|nr:GNAT family N-acetyltransferase [Petrimonas sp.]
MPKQKLFLHLPTFAHQSAAERFKQAFFENGERVIYGSALFDQMEYKPWLEHNARGRHKDTMAEGWVVATTFFVIREQDRKIVGMIDIRHSLDHPFLSEYGGHIGYSVCPNERGKGYGTAILRMGMEFAESIPLKELMLACFSDNVPSIKTIEKNGGVLTEIKPYIEDGQVHIPGAPERMVHIYRITL